MTAEKSYPPLKNRFCHCPSIHQHRVSGDDLWAKLDVCIHKVNQGQSEEEEFNPQFSF
jgi:hypothetical protein